MRVQKWEYTTVFQIEDSSAIDQWLNLYGQEGWELVSCCPQTRVTLHNRVDKGVTTRTETKGLLLIFKRELV